jgi:hypothetical protein
MVTVGRSAVPLFTFYPCRPDGSSAAFETIECCDEMDALVRAHRVLDDHRSAVEVVIWQGERRVGAVGRVADPA